MSAEDVKDSVLLSQTSIDLARSEAYAADEDYNLGLVHADQALDALRHAAILLEHASGKFTEATVHAHNAETHLETGRRIASESLTTSVHPESRRLLNCIGALAGSTAALLAYDQVAATLANVMIGRTAEVRDGLGVEMGALPNARGTVQQIIEQSTEFSTAVNIFLDEY